MNRHAHIEIVPVDVGREDGQTSAFDPHYLRLVASNGQCLAVSERYSSRSKARRGVQAWADAMAGLNGGTLFISNDHVIEVTS